MVDHKVHDDADIAGFGLCDQCVEIRQRAEFGRDVVVIRDVIAVVAHGRAVDRGQPDDSDTEIAQMVEPRNDTGMSPMPSPLLSAKLRG